MFAAQHADAAMQHALLQSAALQHDIDDAQGGDPIALGGPWGQLRSEARTLPYGSVVPMSSAGSSGGGGLPLPEVDETNACMFAQQQAMDHALWQQQAALMARAGGAPATSPRLAEAAAQHGLAAAMSDVYQAPKSTGGAGMPPSGPKMAAMLNMALARDRGKHAAALAAPAMSQHPDDRVPAGDNSRRHVSEVPTPSPFALPPQPGSPSHGLPSGPPVGRRRWDKVRDTDAPSLSRETPSPRQTAPGSTTNGTPASQPEPSPQMSHTASTTAPHPASLAVYAAQHAAATAAAASASPRRPSFTSQPGTQGPSPSQSALPSDGGQADSAQLRSGPWAQQGPWAGFGAQIGSKTQLSPGRAVNSGMVRMPRSEAWAKFLAYEGCIQICIERRGEPEAQYFLSDGMKALREGFGIGCLLLSPADPQQAQVQHAQMLKQAKLNEVEIASRRAASQGGHAGPKMSSEKTKSLWKRGAVKAIVANALTKSAGGQPVPLNLNDICWDDAEQEELQAAAQAVMTTMLPPQPAQQRWNGLASGQGMLAAGPPPGPVAFGGRPGALEVAPASPRAAAASVSEPGLRIGVRHAKKQSGGLLGSLVGWVGQSKGNAPRSALQLRMSCGQQVVSVPLDAKGNAFPGSATLFLGQSLVQGVAWGSGGGALGSMASSGSSGGGAAEATGTTGGAPTAGKELTVELVCSSGPLAGGRIQLQKLWEHYEQSADLEMAPRPPVGANARRGSTGGAVQAAVPEGLSMEVTLFSSSGDVKRVGTLELGIVKVEAAAAALPPRAQPGPYAEGGHGGVVQSPPSAGASYALSGDASGGAGAGNAYGSADSYGPSLQYPYPGPSGPVPAPAAAAGATAPAAPVIGRQPLRMSGCAAMDAMLDAALKGSSCGRELLMVGQPWKWLLQHFASVYDVSGAYVLIAHLRWILKPSVCSLTTHCFTTITQLLTPLLQQEQEWQLTPGEVNLLVQIKRSIQQLLQSGFERYTSLSDTPNTDAQAQGIPEAPPRSYTRLDPTHISPLQAAFELYDVLRDTFAAGAGSWLQACFVTAAKLRWQALLSRSSGESGIDIAALLQAVSVADDLNPGDAIRKLQRGGPGNAHQRAMMQGFDQGGTGNRGSVVPDDHQGRRVSNLSVLSGISSQPRSSIQAEVLYKGLEALSYAICQEVHYDLLLQSCPGLIPEALGLAQATVEEYCGRFVEQLQLVLRECPPEDHSPQAVNLLVAVAEMQRYLEQQGLLLDHRHPGHVSAMGLFRDHVCNWLRASQAGLLHVCQQLEQQQEPSQRSMSALATFAGLDQLPPPQLFDAAAIGGRLSTLVTQMHSRCWGEMQGYARVMKHWAHFGPDLEAAVCRVLRSVLEALKRKYPVVTQLPPVPGAFAMGGMQGSYGAGAPPQLPGPEAAGMWEGGAPGHQRTQSELSGGGGAGGAMAGAMAGGGPGMYGNPPQGPGRRMPLGYSVATPTASPRKNDRGGAGAGVWQGETGHGVYGQQAGGFVPGAAVVQAWQQAYGVARQTVQGGPPSMEVLHTEAVLLNSLKYFMVLVPTLEWELEQWCAESLGLSTSQEQGSQGGSGALSGGPGHAAGGLSPAAAAARSLIGHQFDQFVKELRTEYSFAVTAVACRLFAGLQMQPTTSLSFALAQAPAMGYPGGGYGAVGASGGAEALEALSHHVAGALAALSAALEAALSALRACVEPRVYVAVGRALWDLCGRELHEFVQSLNEGTVDAAWRARQRAETAVRLLNDFFKQRLAVDCDAEMQAQDLQAPRNVDMVQRLLQRSTANANHAYTPF